MPQTPARVLNSHWQNHQRARCLQAGRGTCRRPQAWVRLPLNPTADQAGDAVPVARLRGRLKPGSQLAAKPRTKSIPYVAGNEKLCITQFRSMPASHRQREVGGRT